MVPHPRVKLLRNLFCMTGDSEGEERELIEETYAFLSEQGFINLGIPSGEGPVAVGASRALSILLMSRYHPGSSATEPSKISAMK